MRRYLLYALILAPAVPCYSYLGIVGIPVGIVLGFLVQLTTEVIHTAIVRDATIAFAVSNLCEIVFKPWRFKLCPRCGKWQRKHRSCGVSR